VGFELQLRHGQRRLLDISRRWGPAAMIVVITGVSLLLSVLATGGAMAVQRPPLVDWIISMTMATR
jgi:hypothetical protein